MRRAARTDANHSIVVGCLRACGAKVHDTSGVGGGFPDLVCWHPSRGMFAVEVKDGSKPPSVRKLTPDQVKWHAEWDGAPVYVVERVEDVPGILVKEADVS